MVGYPGQDSDVPKTLLESLHSQPLNYLVPKGILSSCITSQISISLPISNNAYESLSAEAKEELDRDSILDSFSKINDIEEIQFRRPDHLKIRSDSKQDMNNNNREFFDDLSPLAKSLIERENLSITTNQIQNFSVKSVNGLKHKLDVDDDISAIFEGSTEVKRAKISTNISLNQGEILQQNIRELKMMIDILNSTSEGNTENNEYLIKLSSETFLLNEKYLSKLHIIIKNFLGSSNISSKLEINDLRRIIESLIDNIETVKQLQGEEELPLPYDTLKKLAYETTTLIFLIFQLDKNTNGLYIEKYVLVPVQFIGDRIFDINSNDESGQISLDELSLLSDAIVHLPDYIVQHPYLDESIITKITYIFSELVMCDNFDVANIKYQHYWENIKLSSINILVALFRTVPDQRIFIIEDILSHVDKLPSKRIQKKLKRIYAGVYLNEFTILIMTMLQSLQQESFNRTDKEWSPQFFKESLVSYKESSISISTYIEHIHDTLLEKLYENPPGYRHVLDNYVQDLVSILPFPCWSISEDLLSSLMKKLLLMFGPNNQKQATIETIALQILGNIGYTIFDLKCSTKEEDQNSLIRIFNNPELLPLYIAHFHNCLDTAKLYSNTDIGTNYFWNKMIHTLTRLQEYGQDNDNDNKDEDTNPIIPEVVLKELNDKNNHLFQNKEYSKEFSKSDYYSILHSFELMNFYDLYLKLVVSLLERDKIKLRSTAIKCLSMLASRDQSILSSSAVKETIVGRLSDSSASVKDAILDLVSIGSASLTFYRQINYNYDDESILVRKHVLKINESIYDTTDDIKIKIYVASRVLLKIEDEEDAIIDMSRQILLKRWILDISNKKHEIEKQNEICKEVLQVISEVSIFNTKCSELFEWFFNFYLLNKADHSPNAYQNIIDSLNILTEHLVHEIVELQLIDSDNDELVKRRKNYLNLLSKFSDTTVTFITKDHITSLYPYVFNETKSDFQFHVLCVFKDTLGKLDNFKPKFLFDLETALLSQLPKMSVKETEEAMPLIWSIAQKRKDYSRVAKACSSCFGHFIPFVNKANKSPEEITPDSKLQRLIYLATGFARFCNSKDITERINYLQANETLYEYVAKCLLVLSNKKITHIVRRVAIKNLTKLCSSHPKLFNSKHILSLLDNEIKDDHLDIKLVIIESFYDFFIQEEKKSLRQIGVNRSTSKLKFGSKFLIEKGSDSLSEGVCSALASRFLKDVLKICLSKEVKNSLVAFRLLKSMIQFGYVNPSHCIPTIIGLFGSNEEYIRQIAAKSLHDLFEKYETMVFNSVSQGIKIAIEYSQSLGNEDLFDNCKFLSSLQHIIGSGKKVSMRFIKNLIKALNTYIGSINHANTDIATRNAIVFLCCNIAELNFTSSTELITLIKSIDIISEQLRETIVDEITGSISKMQLEEPFKNCIFAEFSIHQLTEYVGDKFGIKSDILLMDSTEEEDLKSKIILTPKENTKEYVSIIKKALISANKKTFYTKYLKIIEDEA
ncbi:hypothetical protein Kpol_1030p7 [Vanderwaltozyma polyspora DSM 70294]|uniref:Sister chromatid cohesion protein n=1 Tax=Vanderwaltozyma polyspora (strain ATCC 22028 / DSM 70294 / BCRC 21397 / CBS 2163 / NBRC 10782 / NRRL Y-8283 / UCD 57-17) TaxID=436907 RepID=A7TMS7_VANPO|nr:uncharacterized protein Kpol_1030p7 [Vanderwaltozyma polyspora DSM 70294]EDO16399.1 hypothetical protein Kpol_1030p7 [Vanderwaltozyma polyspora DSM 70294]